MPAKRLSILGVGLLGGSIGLAAKAAASGYEIVGYGHRLSTVRRAIEIGAIDAAADSPAAAVAEADLVILCTPVGLFREMLREIGPGLKADAIVTDVGSTKRSIVRDAAELLPKSARFVGSHPMAGSEKRGIEFARADLFRGAMCLTTPADATDADALANVEQFWQTLGMRIARLSPDDHDRLLADVSHLPHALAAALVTMQSDDALKLAGKGFLDATRIAGGDGALWRDILVDNRDNLTAALRRLREGLDRLEGLLAPAHSDALARWLNDAASRREALLRQKLQELNPD